MHPFIMAAVALSFVLGWIGCHLALSRKIKNLTALDAEILNDCHEVIREQRELIIRKDILIVKQEALLEKSNEVIKTYIECKQS